MPDSVDGRRMNGTQAAAPNRDLSVDFYRVSAIGLVVVGHWLVASATYHDGEFGLQNPLVEMPWTQWLTLASQVMPASFLMAGYASSASWTRRGEPSAEPPQRGLRQRLARTLGPAGAGAAWGVRGGSAGGGVGAALGGGGRVAVGVRRLGGRLPPVVPGHFRAVGPGGAGGGGRGGAVGARRAGRPGDCGGSHRCGR